MGQQARPRPRYLAVKLLAIRQGLGFSQSEMVHFLNLQISTARVSEYETGMREPNLLVLLAYSRAARVPVEKIIDDELTI